MCAAVVTAFDEPEAVRIVRTPVPEPGPEPGPGPGQVRIRVRAAAVNPVDLATTTGERADVGAALDHRRTRLGLGWDVAGTVDELGPCVMDLAPGTASSASPRCSTRRPRRTAEYVILDADAVAHAPESASSGPRRCR